MPSWDERAHQNLCDFTRFTARLNPGSELLDESGVVAMAGVVDFPTARSAIRSSTELAAGAWVERVSAFLDPRGKTACVCTRVGVDDDITELLTARGFREWAQSPEMICDHALPAHGPPEGVTVRTASTPGDVRAYAEIAGEAFAHLSVPQRTTTDALDHPEVLLGDDCIVALADLDGTPVAGAMVLLFDEEPSGYVGWVACVDAARGRGLGDVVTRAVTNAAFDRGARVVTLEASPFGKSTYKRMGYREIYRYRTLIRI